MEQNKKYGERAHKLIPAGAHTYSRTDEVFPGMPPGSLSAAKAYTHGM